MRSQLLLLWQHRQRCGELALTPTWCARFVWPAAGFMKQLVEWEVELRGKATIDVDKYRAHRFDAVSTFEVSPGPPSAMAAVTEEESDAENDGKK